MSNDFPFELVSFVRHTDPPTSQKAAASRDNRIRWGSQRHKLLEAYAEADTYWLSGLTDEEAGKATGLYASRACYWKRCGELRELGLIKQAGQTRTSACGHEVLVCYISSRGRAALAEMEGKR